ncbi:MAG: pyridoxamine 5'-phosphate oxidase family protein [Sphaerochaetaceae bacterium]|jgi:hypothetical protein|nr:pyridoxamine 5'-phosphate oxidase family protein [Sphaerochaetaceae bacterium]HHU88483.1 pyridoxamine 5'-phosphate oxidase family protein [Spirochaetales bacterium]
MLDPKIVEILSTPPDSAVAIATQGRDGVHLVNTWNSYIEIYEGDKLLIPAGRMEKSEKNLEENARVLVTICHRDVEGLRHKGTGFLIQGEGLFVKEGPPYEIIKGRFPWARAALMIKVLKAEQTL